VSPTSRCREVGDRDTDTAQLSRLENKTFNIDNIFPTILVFTTPYFMLKCKNNWKIKNSSMSIFNSLIQIEFGSLKDMSF
jgi:hypothetical protein